MKKILSLLIILITSMTFSYSQLFSLSDTTITFKNKEGKVLSREEVQQLMKGIFSIRQENADGKKVITIFPTVNDEHALQQAKFDAFKNNLIGKPIAGFKLTDLNNKKWNSKDLNGKVVVINFWFTGCKPCILEIPLLNELKRLYNDSSVVFLALAPENEKQIKKFLTKYVFDYTIIPGATTYIGKLNIENFPTHLVIDKKGIVRQVLIGYSEDIKDKLQTWINKLFD